MASKGLSQTDTLDVLIKNGAILTGSKRFKGKVDSDWDFVVPREAKHWHGWLKAQGFTRIYKEGLWPVSAVYPHVCSDTAEIWEKVFDDGVYFGTEENTIQVVFSKSFAAKKRIIEWLSDRPELMDKYYQTPKSERHIIWQFLEEKAEKGDI